jgi:methanogenic corrinoid protein MtbC1
LQEELILALLRYDETVAEQVISQAFSLYTVEQVGEHLIMPVLVELGERWHQGELSITNEHFATNYLLQRLAALLRALPNIAEGPLVWIGCAPGELHEIAPMLLSIYMRRVGFRVHYFGQNLPIEDFVGAVRHHRPAMVMLSASTVDAVHGLRQLADLLTRIDPPRPIVGYGGRIFNRNPALRTDISGVFLGASAQDAVELSADLLQEAASQRRINAHG